MCLNCKTKGEKNDMTENVRRCLDLTTQIEDLIWRRQQLESELSEDEREQLVALLDQAAEAKSNEAAQLEAYSDVKRATEHEHSQEER